MKPQKPGWLARLSYCGTGSVRSCFDRRSQNAKNRSRPDPSGFSTHRL